MKRISKLLIVSSGAGSITAAVESQLNRAFSDYQRIEFDPKVDFRRTLAPGATVVVAGGDGTIAFVARALVDKDFTLGILSLGTYNNFAKALGMPKSLKTAIEVIKTGRACPVTLGRVNGQPFLEAAAVGLFGEAIALGEAAKDKHFGELKDSFSRVSKAKPFDYTLSGDITGEGTALSLVFANTPSMGANLAIGDATPIESYLELAVHVGESRSDIVGRIVASTIGRGRDDTKLGMRFRFRRLRITTKPKVPLFADNAEVGRTPAEVVADLGALQMILPAAARGRANKASK